MNQADDPIETYLDELLLASRALPAREARHLIAEAEAHLRDAAEAATQAGASEREAACAAVADFGPVAELVRPERERLRTPLRVLAAQLMRSAYVLGAIGAISVGISGAIAGVIYWIGGAGAVAPAPSPSDLTPSNCARWIALAHGSGCRAGAITDWANETVSYRLAFGLLGAIALLAYWVINRRRGAKPGLAPIVTESIATTLFLLAAVGSLLLGIYAFAAKSGSGAGQWFSAMPVAAGAAAIFGSRVARRLRVDQLGS